MAERIGVVIVAAGSSTRMQGVDKLWLSINGLPLITYSVGLFTSLPEIDIVTVVLSQANRERVNTPGRTTPWDRVVVTEGGTTRADSVYAGLHKLGNCDLVLVHDGARPFVSPKMIECGLDTARRYGSAIPALPVSDTVKRVDEKGMIVETVNRESLRTVQTPQIFSYTLLLDAYEAIGEDRVSCTDEAMLLERLGHRVATFPGDPRNIKITHPQDIPLATFLATNPITE